MGRWMAMLAVMLLPVAGAHALERSVMIGDLAASVVTPAGARLGVVIIAGSGPTDRNGNSPQGVKSDAYRQLAVALGEAGFASVRYDKRGVAESAAAAQRRTAASTAQTYAEDAAAVANWLAGQPGLSKVVLLGHSEGGLLALLAAETRKVDGLVVLTTAGRPLGVVLREQLLRQNLPPDISGEAERVIKGLETGQEVDPVEPPLDRLFPAGARPFLRSIISIDPTRLLAARPEPVLVIGGGKDIQVVRSDFDHLLAARPGLRSHWEAEATHTLKLAIDGDLVQMKTYTDPTVPLAPGIVKSIVGFLKTLAP